MHRNDHPNRRDDDTAASDANAPLPRKDEVDQPLNDEQVSGTDIAGDETNVRTRDGIQRPGIADTIPPQPE